MYKEQFVNLKDPERYKFIDSLRGIAILLVLIVHNSFAGVENIFFSKLLNKIIYNGRFGVELFFMLSALTLTLSIQNRKNEVHHIRDYFIRRLFRIAPMYYVAIMYYSFQRLTGYGYKENVIIKDFDTSSFFSNVFFYHGFSPNTINDFVPGGWSIADEVIFYLILPLILHRIKNINQNIIFLVSSLFLSILLKLVFSQTSIDQNQFLYYYFPSQLPVFILGIMAYFTIKRNGELVNSYSWILIGLVHFYYFYFYSIAPEHLLYSVFFFYIILSQFKGELLLISNRFTAYLGKISYSMYFIHFVVLNWLDFFDKLVFIKVDSLITAYANFSIRFIILTFFTVIISDVCYRYIELTGQKYGKYLILRLNKYDQNEISFM